MTERKIPGFGGSTSGDYSSAYILFYQRAGTNIGGSFSNNIPSISQFGGMNIMEESLENRNFSLDRLSSFNSKLLADASPVAENNLIRSRNNSNEKSSIKTTQNNTDDNDNNIQSAEISMIVETEEGHRQPDLSEIIRSLDTPPPS